MKENALVYTHLGLGDMFMMNGAVRFIKEKYKDIYVMCKEIYKDTVSAMYKDDLGIHIFSIKDDDDLYPWNEQSQYFLERGVDVYSCGNYSLKSEKGIYDFPYSFYDDMDIPRSVRKTHFRVPRTDAAKALYESFGGRPYVLVHQEASTHTLPIVERLRAAGETRLIVDLNKNQVNRETDAAGYELAASAIYRPFMEYVSLMEGADELHLIDSSIFAFTIHLNLEKVKRCLYYIRPGGNTVDSFDKFEAVTDYM